MNFKNFVIFCVFFVLSSQFVDGSASCLYENHNRLGYTCRLSVSAELSENILEISGVHLSGRTDDDVVSIQKHKIPNLQLLPAGLCEKFKNVDKINMPASKIQQIDENAFKNCRNLQKVVLDENVIEELSGSLFSENTKLEHVSLMFNSLITLPDDFFINNQNLKSLNLMGNKIKFLPENIFKNLTELTSMLLVKNEIAEVNPLWFRDSQNLQMLMLSENLISELPKGTFVALKSINRLILAANNLSVIDAESFGIHNNLKFFDVQSNNINAVDENFLIAAPTMLLFEMLGNKCYSNRLRNVTAGSIEVQTALGSCFDNFKELIQKKVETTTEEIFNTTYPSINMQEAEMNPSKYDQILKILAELKDEVRSLRDENREIKEQQIEMLKLMKKL
ncbi:hypothetical protein ACKWTF_015802 [Chironomus riparius]